MLSGDYMQLATYQSDNRFTFPHEHYINEPNDIKYSFAKNHNRDSKENAPLNVTTTIPLNVLPPPPHKLNNNARNHSKKRNNRRSSNGRSESPLGYESDESYKSYSSQGRMHKNGKLGHREKLRINGSERFLGFGNYSNFQRSELCLYNQVQIFGKVSQSSLDMNQNSKEGKGFGQQQNFFKQHKKFR